MDPHHSAIFLFVLGFVAPSTAWTPNFAHWKGYVANRLERQLRFLKTVPSVRPYRCPYPPVCPSFVYCQGPLLRDAQYSGLFNDSKSFVDLKLNFPERVILEKYEQLKTSKNGQLSKDDIDAFIRDNFSKGDELIPCVPEDFKPEPSLLKYIQDPNYRKWARELNEIWKTLMRRMDTDVLVNPEMHSLLYVPNCFVIPGGRFLELYYWDTYWIIKGLLLCDMVDTARGMIDNILYIVKIYGYMLNGTRKYYQNRSQPPLLIPMVAAYFQLTQDKQYIEDNIQILETEFQFWMTKRMTDVIKDGVIYKLAHYNVATCGPRPESYKEDSDLASNFTSEEERTNIYIELKSGAETGWDFSHRWEITSDGCKNTGSLLNLKTRSIIPVDLNSFLQLNAHHLSEWFYLLGDIQKGDHYKLKAEELLTAIETVLWREDMKSWFDWDNLNGQTRDCFYASNLTPLWTGSYRRSPKEMGKLAVEYLISQGIISADGTPRYLGVPTTLENNGQQWEKPNLWAPLQLIAIQGLDNTMYPKAQQVAYKLAAKFVETTYAGYVRTGQMFEKYDESVLGAFGGGGEYVLQTGFGWTNGGVCELLAMYGSKLRSPTDLPTDNSAGSG